MKLYSTNRTSCLTKNSKHEAFTIIHLYFHIKTHFILKRTILAPYSSVLGVNNFIYIILKRVTSCTEKKKLSTFINFSQGIYVCIHSLCRSCQLSMIYLYIHISFYTSFVYGYILCPTRWNILIIKGQLTCFVHIVWFIIYYDKEP